MTSTKKKSVLDMKLFSREEINKNNIVFAIAYTIHKYKITFFADDFLQFINTQHREYWLDILTIIPDERREIKEQIIYQIGPVNPRDMKKLFEVFKNDGEFCRFIIEQNECHQQIVDHASA